MQGSQRGRPNGRRMTGAFVALAIGVGMGGCGDGEDDAVPAVTAAPTTSSAPPIIAPAALPSTSTAVPVTTAPAPAPPITVETTAPPVTVAAPSYSSATITYTKSDGWTYQLVPHFSTVTLGFSKDISHSPPGKARLVVTITVAGDMDIEVLGATPGRTPPQTVAGFGLFLPLADGAAIYGTSAGSNQNRENGLLPAFSCKAIDYTVASTQAQIAQEAQLPSAAGFQCANQTGGIRTELETGGISVSGEDNEDFIDQLIEALRNAPVIVAVGMLDTSSNSCGRFFYWPDGTTTAAAICPATFG